jgi:hypothetical protein
MVTCDARVRRQSTTDEFHVPQENAPPQMPNYLTPEDMQHWLQQEIADSAKALELRIKEATGFVTAYASGKITPEEADEKHWRYQHRWGEALPGTHVAPGSGDDQIMASIDKAAGEYVTPRQTRDKYRSLFDRPSGDPRITR